MKKLLPIVALVTVIAVTAAAQSGLDQGAAPPDATGTAGVVESAPPEMAPEPVEIIPKEIPVTRYLPLWENSPFNRVVVRAVTTTISSTFGKDLVLEGLVNDKKRGPIAFVRDTKENVPFTISSEKSSGDYPYTIVSANKDADPQKTTVTITDGNEQAEIGYQANILTQAIRTPRQQARPNAGENNEGRPAAARAREAQQRNQAGGGNTPPPGRQLKPTSQPPQAESEPEEDPLERIDDPTRRRLVPLPKGVAN